MWQELVKEHFRLIILCASGLLATIPFSIYRLRKVRLITEAHKEWKKTTEKPDGTVESTEEGRPPNAWDLGALSGLSSTLHRSNWPTALIAYLFVLMITLYIIFDKDPLLGRLLGVNFGAVVGAMLGWEKKEKNK